MRSAMLVLLLCLFGTSALAAEPLVIADLPGMKAFFYHQESGTLGDRDLLGSQDISLWNVFIGEGSAGGQPSNATLVLVEVACPDFAKAKGTLHVMATEGKKVLARQAVPLKDLGAVEKHSVHFPVLLYQTGTAPVKITATIKGMPGMKKAPTLTRELPFAFGE